MKKLSVIILSLMLVILTCPAALADQTEPAADYTSTQFFLNPSALNSPCQAWYAWTWGNSSGRWVKGDKDGENYRFAELDSNIVFAGMYSDAEPSWDKSVMWNQTTDLCYDGVNNLFTPYQLAEDGKLTGISRFRRPNRFPQPSRRAQPNRPRQRFRIRAQTPRSRAIPIRRRRRPQPSRQARRGVRQPPNLRSPQRLQPFLLRLRPQFRRATVRTSRTRPARLI